MVVLQLYQDNLWSAADKTLSLPLTPVPVEGENVEKKQTECTVASNEAAAGAVAINDTELTETENSEPKNESELDQNLMDKMSSLNANPESSESVAPKEPEAEEEAAACEKSKEEEQSENEQLLYDSFMLTIKYKSKDIKLPVIVSTFMKLMQQVSVTQFDLKKTKYKKVLKTFFKIFKFRPLNLFVFF